MQAVPPLAPQVCPTVARGAGSSQSLQVGLASFGIPLVPASACTDGEAVGSANLFLDPR